MDAIDRNNRTGAIHPQMIDRILNVAYWIFSIEWGYLQNTLDSYPVCVFVTIVNDRIESVNTASM